MCNKENAPLWIRGCWRNFPCGNFEWLICGISPFIYLLIAI